MCRLLGFCLLVVFASLGSGCAMCCAPYDEAYGYTGGRWPRTDLCHGRVGSAFAPASGEATVIDDGAWIEGTPQPAQPQGKSVRQPASDWSGDLMPQN